LEQLKLRKRKKSLLNVVYGGYVKKRGSRKKALQEEGVVGGPRKHDTRSGANKKAV